MLRLVNNEEKYYEFIFKLRFCDENIESFVIQTVPSYNDHYSYMLKYNDNYYICLDGDNPVGFIGVIDDDIRLATIHNKKNQGIGKFMVNELMEKYPNAIAKVKIDNQASLKLFQSCGFKPKYLILEKEYVQ